MPTEAKLLRAAIVAAAAALIVTACKPAARVEERQVIVYSPRSCPVDQARAFAVVYAGGDFEPSADAPPVASLFLRDVDAPMAALPSATRSLVVDVTHPAQGVDWRGVATVPPQGPVSVLVWPQGETCRLSRNVIPREGAIFGVFGHHLLVAGGRATSAATVPETYVGDLSRGVLDSLKLGLGTRRTKASVTSSRQVDAAPTAAIVAGGEDPDTGVALASAEIYVPDATSREKLGDFDRTRVSLSEPRSEHGAVMLHNGETLLVGGMGLGGPLRTLEIIDPVSRNARLAGALLLVPRRAPTVLRLASGEILVAGGVDARGEPVPTLEWFAPDASRPTKRPQDLVTGRERGFVALDAGGALAVIAPTDTSAPNFNNVWMITAEGGLEPGVALDPTELEVVRLFPGTDGAPALWTGKRWMRWQPWFGAFQAIADAPTSGPGAGAVASGDAGLALWIEDAVAPSDMSVTGTFVAGYRFSTRSEFAAAPKPLLDDGPAFFVPDRLAGPGRPVRYDNAIGLVLGPGASAFLADLTFADVDVDLDVTSAAPYVVMRQTDGVEVEIGGVACAFAAAARQHLHVERRGSAVSAAIDGGEPRACPGTIAEGARVSIGLRGNAGVPSSSATHFSVSRR